MPHNDGMDQLVSRGVPWYGVDACSREDIQAIDPSLLAGGDAPSWGPVTSNDAATAAPATAAAPPSMPYDGFGGYNPSVYGESLLSTRAGSCPPRAPSRRRWTRCLQRALPSPTSPCGPAADSTRKGCRDTTSLWGRWRAGACICRAQCWVLQAPTSLLRTRLHRSTLPVRSLRLIHRLW